MTEEKDTRAFDKDDSTNESLLSLAKDARYIAQCQALIEQVIEPMLTNYNSQSRSELQKVTMFISYILYTLLVVAPTGRTLGMEAVGLAFEKSTNKRRLVVSLLAATIGAFTLDRLTNKSANGITSSREALRGGDRRQMHEILRRQMLERSSSQPSESFERNSPNSNLDRDHHRVDSSISPFQEQIISIFRHISKFIIEAMFSSEGPHSLHSSRALQSTFSVAKWVLRLHLAQYCVAGKYPTIFHRLLGLKHDRQERKIVHLSNTNRIVALLIALQASAKFTQWSTKCLMRKIASYLESASGSSPRQSLTKYFPKDESANGKGAILQSSGTTCAICRTHRSCPAVPSSCGHVFCWNCLIQWVSTVRPECPLCRASCRPQDILPLHNYETLSNSERLAGQGDPRMT